MGFRYIGSKDKLSDIIISEIKSTKKGAKHIIDLMAGTGLFSLALREEGFKVSASMLDGDLVKAAAEELELSLPSSRSSWAQKAAMLAALLALMLIGAAAAAFVFRSDLSVLFENWQNTPSFPSPPRPGAPEPINTAPTPR